jgi:rod shape determining protein RodA
VDENGDAYALSNNLKAIGSAGWEGKGYEPSEVPPETKSMTHLKLISQETAHTDYIFTVISEAFGFRGAALLIMGFLFVMLMGLAVALFSRDPLGRIMTIGIISLIFAHFIEHIGMNIGVLPITGIPLPLISYGGTFVLVILFLMGLVQSVWVHRNKVIEEADAKAKKPERAAWGMRTARETS